MQIEQTLRAAFVPRGPGADFEDVVMARVSAAAWRASRASRKPSRVILFGTVLVVAAAAAILASRIIRSPSVPAALPAVARAVTEAPVDSRSSVDTGTVAVQVHAATTPAVPADTSFTVLVQPLRFDTDDPAAVASVQQYYGFALDELRAIPGLVLINVDMSTEATAPADFRLTVTGLDAEDTEFLAGRARWQVVLKAESWQTNAFRTVRRQQSAGTLDLGSCPFAADLAVEMCSPSGVAAGNIRELRKSVFPGTPMSQNELQTRFRDSDLSAAERNQALLEIASHWRSGDAPLDEHVIRGILDLIASSSGANQRASLRRQLRGQKHPVLVQPLVDASRDGSDDVVRLEAVTTLAADFKDDPVARAALEWVADTDPKLLVRKVAERALSGDAAWREYVVSSVKNASLSVPQRFEPLDWMLDSRQTDSTMKATMAEVAPELLEGGAGALADVLVRASKEKVGSLSGLASAGMMEFMSSVNHPAVPDLLIACFDGMPSETTLYFLAQHHDDSRVHKKLEDVAAGHPDQKLRERAATYLRKPPSASQSAPVAR